MATFAPDCRGDSGHRRLAQSRPSVDRRIDPGVAASRCCPSCDIRDADANGVILSSRALIAGDADGASFAAVDLSLLLPLVSGHRSSPAASRALAASPFQRSPCSPSSSASPDVRHLPASLPAIIGLRQPWRMKTMARFLAAASGAATPSTTDRSACCICADHRDVVLEPTCRSTSAWAQQPPPAPRRPTPGAGRFIAIGAVAAGLCSAWSMAAWCWRDRPTCFRWRVFRSSASSTGLNAVRRLFRGASVDIGGIDRRRHRRHSSPVGGPSSASGAPAFGVR